MIIRFTRTKVTLFWRFVACMQCIHGMDSFFNYSRTEKNSRFSEAYSVRRKFMNASRPDSSESTCFNASSLGVLKYISLAKMSALFFDSLNFVGKATTTFSSLDVGGGTDPAAPMVVNQKLLKMKLTMFHDGLEPKRLGIPTRDTQNEMVVNDILY